MNKHKDTPVTVSGIVDSKSDTITLPRWVVYFQAALLGLVATTCFIFGIMVGSINSASGPNASANRESLISGVVGYRSDTGSNLTPDRGAVVFLLPDPPTEVLRQDPESVRPDSFEPLENPTIDWIRSVGGSVVRTNTDGRFELFADAGDYNLLIVSKSRAANKTQKLSKEQVASISQYFLPVEKLIQRQYFYWKPLSADEPLIDLGEIETE